MRNLLLYISLMLTLTTKCLAQTDIVAENIGDSTTITPEEQQLSKLFNALKESDNDSVSLKLNAEIEQLLQNELQNPTSFNQSYTTVKNLGKCYSDDQKARVYSWAFALSDNSMRYGCFVQIKGKKGIQLYQLHSTSSNYIPTENKTIDTKNWYGCIYYSIFRHPDKNKQQYILLGWAKGTVGSEYKAIETIDIDKKGILLLGKDDLFRNKGKLKKRVVLQYSNMVHMSLNHDSASGSIIFDHLVPSEAVYTGIYSYYGPDFTYDAYKYAKKQKAWELEENVDAKNKE